jgi:hypothetical protein
MDSVRRAAVTAALVCALPACVGTTGSDLVTFDAAAAGPADAVAGQPYSFTSGRGFRVMLTRATLHVGAVYLNRARPVSGAQETSCILPGIYVGEVTSGLDVDVLSPEPQPFPAPGEGTQTRAIVGEVWLSHGDVDAPPDVEPVLRVEGTAEKDSAAYPFEGTLTIGENRAVPASDPSLPSQHPICKERIVSPIDVSLTPRNGGSLLLRVDPRGWFANVDFAALRQVEGAPPRYAFDDATTAGPDAALYRGLQSRSGVYQLLWSDPQPN